MPGKTSKKEGHARFKATISVRLSPVNSFSGTEDDEREYYEKYYETRYYADKKGVKRTEPKKVKRHVTMVLWAIITQAPYDGKPYWFLNWYLTKARPLKQLGLIGYRRIEAPASPAGIQMDGETTKLGGTEILLGRVGSFGGTEERERQYFQSTASTNRCITAKPDPLGSGIRYWYWREKPDPPPERETHSAPKRRKRNKSHH